MKKETISEVMREMARRKWAKGITEKEREQRRAGANKRWEKYRKEKLKKDI